MKEFKISLTRTYIISIKATNKDEAKQYTEYFLGDCQDLSSEKDRVKYNFFIEDLKMVHNEAQNT